MISVYQGSYFLALCIFPYLILICLGGAIMMMSLILFENEFLNIVSISFTALVLNELIMVAVEVTMW